MKQKLLAILCALFIVQMAAWAEETSGYCGDPDVNGGKSVRWRLSWDDDMRINVLTISGAGAMADYYDTFSPWAVNYGIGKIIIIEGVTSIGNYAFMHCHNLTSISIPNTVTSIGNKASDWAQCFSTIEQIDPNAIRGIEAGRKNIPTTIHDLGGRRVTEPVKGRIYIVDGKTVVW